MRLFLAILALVLFAPAATAQTSVDARRVTVAGVPLTTVLADKPSSTALAAKADKTAVDAALAGKAPLASPSLTGDPKAPSPVATDADTSVATTLFAEPRRPKNRIVRMTASGGNTAGLIEQLTTIPGTSTITLPAGSISLTFTETIPTITANNLTIQGSGNASIIQVPCGHSGRVFTINGSLRLVLRDIYIQTATGCPAGQRPTQHAIQVDGCVDCLFENIRGIGGYGGLLLGASATNSRVLYRNIDFTGLEAALPCTATVQIDGEPGCGRGIQATRGTSQYFDNVRMLFDGVGAAGVRAILLKSQDEMDTWRFSRVVAYSRDGLDANFTEDLTDYSIANVVIDTAVFDSPRRIGVEVIASANPAVVDPEHPYKVASIFQMLNTRIGADLATGSGLRVKIANPNAFIKMLDLAGNYISSKDPLGYNVSLEGPAGSLRAGILRDNTFGEAVPTGSARAAAVLIGMDNVRATNNALSSVKEDAVNAIGNTLAFFKVTRAAVRVLLTGNQATLSSVTALLDESTAAIGAGRVVANNYP